ncbi:ArnT family glycosyltransferase [Mastigocladopsis repens]|uniref:ArnT family glycosyltransferase n=1 Tax=Mastigocladopsis repens TaxID=221287 RepID=UPI0003148172|nr:glycosyltransferase family 39 protein [Mastigocladopsis repens]
MPKLKNFLFHLLIIFLIAGFLLAIRFKPITQTFELDYDEGLNLIKTLLYSQGFSLYTQIWNDQPPLFTVLLSQWFTLFGESVFAARFLVMLFSALLLWCFFQIIRRDLGILPALVATLLLFTSWLYIRLSISVMIGIPSLSLAMLSIYFLTLYKERFHNSFIILSGGLLALSLQTKLFTIILLPLILFSILNFNLKAIQQKKLWFNPFVLWLGTLSVIYIIIGLSYQQFSNFDQLLQSHLNQPIEKELVNFNNINYLPRMMSQDYDYIFLALIGILAIFLKKRREGLFPLTWLGTSLLFILNHKPIWYHHYPLLAIPICWLAGYGVALLLDLLSKNFKSANIKKLIFPSLAVVLFIVLVVATPANPKGRPPNKLEAMQLVLKYKDSTHWVFTDRPIYAFYAGLRVPPEIAVMSYKRLHSRDLTSKELLAVLQKYRPEQIVLARWTGQIKSDSQLIAYINKNYSKTYTDEKGITEHYILSALKM